MLLESSAARTLFRLSIPGVIGAVLFSGLSIVEVAYLHEAGTEALAAVAVVFPLVMLSGMFSAGAFGGAVNGATARALGSGDLKLAGAVLFAAIVIAVAGGAIKAGIVLMVGPSLYGFATDNTEVVNAAIVYASILFPAMPIYWLVNMLSSVLRGSGDMVSPLIIAGVMVVSYMLFGIVLIGHEMVLAETIRAAAIAMVLAYLVALAVTLWFVLRRQQPIRLSASSVSLPVAGAVFKQGLLAGSQSLMTIVYALTATILFSRFGTDWLAGYGLAVRLELVMVPVIFGVGGALIALVGTYVGAGRRRRAIEIAWMGILVNSSIIAVIGILFSLKPGWWCETFGSSPGVYQQCAASLQVLGPTYGFFALGLGCYFASQGLNTLVYPVLGALLRLLIVASGLVWVSAETSPTLVLGVVALAVATYGIFVAIALARGPWSVKALPADKG